MTSVYKAVYNMPGIGEITSVVVDKDEFERFVRTFPIAFPEMDEKTIQQFLDAKHVPMIVKGSKTQQFFDAFGVETSRMCVIIRGSGEEVAMKVLSSPPIHETN